MDAPIQFAAIPTALNLVAGSLTHQRPWEYAPDPVQLQKNRTMPKLERRKSSLRPDFVWNFYTTVEGIAPNQRVSKENTANTLYGLVADYDESMSLESVVQLLHRLPSEHQPNFIERSIGGNYRLVWMFDRPVHVRDSAACAVVVGKMFDKFRVRTLLPGYDAASEKPSEVWMNGAEWYLFRQVPIPFETVIGFVIDSAKKVNNEPAEIPYEVIAEEVEKRWPGRWQGEFELDRVGVRFWDAQADCPTGCQVKPDGMLCFTGPVGFMPWAHIFGGAWADEQRSRNLGRAAHGIYFDGKNYWRQIGGVYQRRDRADIALFLKGQGLSTRVGKGKSMSDVEQVLLYIQDECSVEGAAPVVNEPPGMTILDGRRVLNTSQLTPLQPSEKLDSDPDDFSWIWNFINGLFDQQEHGSTHHFFAWLQRFYRSTIEYQSELGQAIFLCGPRNNGKTLLCARIIKPLVGDKMANPYDYLVGDTQFNSDLFEAPLWAINDEESPRERVKEKFLQRLKSMVVNPSHTYHPKFLSRVPITWVGRIFVTLNDDPQSVGILPEMNQNTVDKLMFFASREYEGEWPKRSVLEPMIKKELPFFARWILDNYTPPEDVIIGGRMGVKSFFDSRILDMSTQQAYFFNFLELLRMWCEFGASWSSDELKTWVGTSSRLFSEFSMTDSLAALIRSWHPSTVAKALTALARHSENTGVKLAQVEGERIFEISREGVLNSKRYNDQLR